MREGCIRGVQQVVRGLKGLGFGMIGRDFPVQLSNPQNVPVLHIKPHGKHALPHRFGSC